MTTDTNEATKRHELRLLVLRAGYTQAEAQQDAAEVPTEKLDELLKMLRESTKGFPERQIVPPGAVDLADVKSQRKDVQMEAEETEHNASRNRLAELMAQWFIPPEMPLVVIQALLDALEAGGADRLAALEDIIKTAESLRKWTEDGRT